MNGNNLRALRLYAGLTQKELSQKIGFSETTISLVENGIKPISPTFKMRLSRVIDINSDVIKALENFNKLGEIATNGKRENEN